MDPNRPALALLLLILGCGHDLRSGRYQLRPLDGPTLDTCNLMPAGTALPDGTLFITGGEVDFDLELFGGSSPVRMIGLFKKQVVGEPDGFTVDGSVGSVQIPVRGTSCIVPFGQIHVTASVVSTSDNAFEGSLTINHDLLANQDPRCPLSCDLEVRYRADLYQ